MAECPWLALWESCRRRRLRGTLAVTVYPLRLRFAQPPLPKGEAMNTGKGIFWRMSASLRGKGPRKPKGFSWSVQGSLRGNRNPLRLVFFLPLFLLEKQKKKWDCTCKFVEGYQPYARIKNMQNKAGTASDPSRPLPEKTACLANRCGQGQKLQRNRAAFWTPPGSAGRGIPVRSASAAPAKRGV